MRKKFLCGAAIGAIAIVACSVVGLVPASHAATVKFVATDEPGPWFKCDTAFEGGFGCVPFSVAKTQSLAIVSPGTEVQLTTGGQSETVHTFTSLLWPKGAKNMPFDQPAAYLGTRSVVLETQGLYVFVCKLHPFMLAAAIVDKDSLGGGGLELSNEVTLLSYNQTVSIPTSSDLATRLLRAFFLITNPANYQNYNLATNPSRTWHIEYPAVPVKVDIGPVNLKDVLEARYGNDSTLPVLFNPSTPGVGEVWIDAEYEKTASKTKPGTAIAVDTGNWTVTKRVALPSINMNNPHNMWTDRDQSVIYQTQWFSNKLTVFNRITGGLIRNITVGHAPAHVMTRVDTDQVHVSINGADEVVELSKFATGIDRHIPTQFPGELPAQPHAHWMSFDGKTMVTPNSNTNDSTRINIGLPQAPIDAKTPTGTLPIASGMMPDASKYYVSNYLDSTITCISIGAPACKDGANTVATKNIHLLVDGFLAGVNQPLANYNPISGAGFSTSGGLPIQTPVSPNGKFVVTANTLTGTITIIDTNTDELVKVLPCSAGCHGVNFGAKKDPKGGYYAYVSSKFSNDLIVVDPDPNNNGDAKDAKIAGRVVLVAGSGVGDDPVSAYAGMGGQGVLPIPLVYNGWVQNLPPFWKNQLTSDQKNPFPQE